jgi:hypothetical protein
MFICPEDILSKEVTVNSSTGGRKLQRWKDHVPPLFPLRERVSDAW